MPNGVHIRVVRCHQFISAYQTQPIGIDYANQARHREGKILIPRRGGYREFALPPEPAPPAGFKSQYQGG